MRGRIYHIGLPKTGTTSIQHILQEREDYIGVIQPRTRRQSQQYKTITNYIRKGDKIIEKDLPNEFIYSEEMICVNHEHNVVRKNLQRLCKLLRPCDAVVITIRNEMKMKKSAYYEFYRFLRNKSLDQINDHPLMFPFERENLYQIIPKDFAHQFYFSELETGHKAFGDLIEMDLPKMMSQKKKNQRKYDGNKIYVQSGDRPVINEIVLKFLDMITNPMLRLMGKKPNQFQSIRRPTYTFIDPVDDF